MKKIFLLILLFSSYQSFFSQNIISNGNFETYTICPDSINGMEFPVPWYDPTNATSDYYNACSQNSFLSVPYQWGSGITYFQMAHSGVAYAGFYTYSSGANYREYVQAILNDTLEANKRYSVEFYVNLQNYCRYASNNIGCYISNTPITTTPPNILAHFPQIVLSGNPVINDTLNWIKIYGIYMAIGGEKYITIGNFNNDTSTITEISDTTSVALLGSYYYLDDVSIIPYDSLHSSINEISLAATNNIRLYPNPNDGNMTLEYQLNENEKGLFIIYDVTGKQLQSYNFNAGSSQLSINADTLHAGVYLYDVFINNVKAKTDRIVIVK